MIAAQSSYVDLMATVLLPASPEPQVMVQYNYSIMRGVQMDIYEEIVRMWRGWHVASASDIDVRLNNFRILFAYNSGKIENEAITYHDTREIFENGRASNFTGNPRALLAPKHFD